MYVSIFRHSGVDSSEHGPTDGCESSSEFVRRSSLFKLKQASCALFGANAIQVRITIDARSHDGRETPMKILSAYKRVYAALLVLGFGTALATLVTACSQTVASKSAVAQEVESGQIPPAAKQFFGSSAA